MENFKKLSNKEKKAVITAIVARCRQLGHDYIKNWKSVDPSWPTVDGCSYLRLSTEEQVAVDRGSLEQQVNIAISEAVIRSQSNKAALRAFEWVLFRNFRAPAACT